MAGRATQAEKPKKPPKKANPKVAARKRKQDRAKALRSKIGKLRAQLDSATNELGRLVSE